MFIDSDNERCLLRNFVIVSFYPVHAFILHVSNSEAELSSLSFQGSLTFSRGYFFVAFNIIARFASNVYVLLTKFVASLLLLFRSINFSLTRTF